MTTCLLRARLVSSSPSLLDTTLLDHANRHIAYALFTDPQARTTAITRRDSDPATTPNLVACIQWGGASPAILFCGDTVPIDAGEMLYSTSVLGK
jgi:hypothetical protein